MKKVKLLTMLVSPTKTWEAGEIVSLEDREADDLVKVGSAEYAERETATSKQRERAEFRR